VMKLVKETYQEWNAEVVFITSNMSGNQEIMEGCKEAGIPAFVRPIIAAILVFARLTMHRTGHTLGFLIHVRQRPRDRFP
jgi:hypothetical protein